MLASIGAIVTAASQAACLPMVPPAAVVIGWTYLANDAKVSGLREYLRGTLAVDLLATGSR